MTDATRGAQWLEAHKYVWEPKMSYAIVRIRDRAAFALRFRRLPRKFWREARRVFRRRPIQAQPFSGFGAPLPGTRDLDDHDVETVAGTRGLTKSYLYM
jgi:hypothetical protein